MVEFSVLYGSEFGVMLLGKNLSVLDGLNGAVIVVLVDLSVDSCRDILVLMWLDCLVLDMWCNCLMDCGVMVSGLGHEVVDCGFGFLHFGGDDWYRGV